MTMEASRYTGFTTAPPWRMLPSFSCAPASGSPRSPVRPATPGVGHRGLPGPPTGIHALAGRGGCLPTFSGGQGKPAIQVLPCAEGPALVLGADSASRQGEGCRRGGGFRLPWLAARSWLILAKDAGPSPEYNRLYPIP